MTISNGPITAWSYSRLSVYRTCPAQAKYKFIMKLPDPASPAMARGDTIHKLAEAFVNWKQASSKLPEELSNHSDFFKELRKKHRQHQKNPENPYIETERMLIFKNDWTPTVWNDWNGAWLRVKVDLIEETAPDVINVIDYKTGKKRPEDQAKYLEQLDLYSTAILAEGHWDKVVTPRLIFLDLAGAEAEVEGATRRIEELPTLKKYWEKESRPLLRDKTFKPTPGDGCRWCNFSAAKGGPCKY